MILRRVYPAFFVASRTPLQLIFTTQIQRAKQKSANIHKEGSGNGLIKRLKSVYPYVPIAIASITTMNNREKNYD